ncbi:MAG: hypothetical protein WCK54_13445 [Desulfuromonadales bacterium]
MNTKSAISTLIKEVPDPSLGLPEDVFYYISRTTPLLNVDLLIKDECGRTLLSWRDDPYTGEGWHIPGGIVRFKESLESRVTKVAQTEIGTSIQFDPVPIAVHQSIHNEREIRGHFISFLYKCFLPSTFKPANKEMSYKDRGYLFWHASCPENLLGVHEIYKKFINNLHDQHDPKKEQTGMNLLNECQTVRTERIL